MKVTDKKLLKNLKKGKYDGVCAEYSDGKLSWGFSIEKGKPKSWTKESCPLFGGLGLGKVKVQKYKRDDEKLMFLKNFGNDEAFRDFPELAIVTLGNIGYKKAQEGVSYLKNSAENLGERLALKDRMTRIHDFGWRDLKNAALAYIKGEDDNDAIFWEKPDSLTKKDIIIVSGVAVAIAGICALGYIFKDRIFKEADTSWVSEREENM